MIATLWAPPWKALLVLAMSALSWMITTSVPLEEASTGYLVITSSGSLKMGDANNLSPPYGESDADDTELPAAIVAATAESSMNGPSTFAISLASAFDSRPAPTFRMSDHARLLFEVKQDGTLTLPNDVTREDLVRGVLRCYGWERVAAMLKDGAGRE